MRLTPILAIGLALAGCARTETPEEARAASAASQAEYDGSVRQAADSALDAGNSPGQIDAGGGEISNGRWVVSETEAGGVAAFGEEGAAPIVTVRCAAVGGVEFRRTGVTVAETPLISYISLAEGESRFAASADPAAPGAAVILVQPDNALIEQLLDNAGPITIRMTGQPRLVVPNAPELIGLVSTCGAAPAPAAPAQPPVENGQ